MGLDAEHGKKMLQLLTSRYDDRHWRKKIEKTLSLPQSGVGDETQRRIFLYFKHALKAYKSHRAGVTTIVMPKDNEKDLADIPKNVLDQMQLHLVDTMDEVLKLSLAGPLPAAPPPSPAPEADLDMGTMH